VCSKNIHHIPLDAFQDITNTFKTIVEEQIANFISSISQTETDEEKKLKVPYLIVSWASRDLSGPAG
jgi:hypothetical protein